MLKKLYENLKYSEKKVLLIKTTREVIEIEIRRIRRTIVSVDNPTIVLLYENGGWINKEDEIEYSDLISKEIDEIEDSILLVYEVISTEKLI